MNKVDEIMEQVLDVIHASNGDSYHGEKAKLRAMIADAVKETTRLESIRSAELVKTITTCQSEYFNDKGELKKVTHVMSPDSLLAISKALLSAAPEYEVTK